MIPQYINEVALDKIIRDAIREDIGEGDHSTLAVIPEGKSGTARLLAKENGIIAGLELAEIIYGKFNKKIAVIFYFGDGEAVRKGDLVFEVEGDARDILSS